MKVRSMVGLIPLFAVAVLDERDLEAFPEFVARTDWFLDHRPDLARRMTVMIDRASADGNVRFFPCIDAHGLANARARVCVSVSVSVRVCVCVCVNVALIA
jgi:hypothetical protein